MPHDDRRSDDSIRGKQSKKERGGLLGGGAKRGGGHQRGTGGQGQKPIGKSEDGKSQSQKAATSDTRKPPAREELVMQRMGKAKAKQRGIVNAEDAK